ncbi:hypothetical protein D9M68_829470 [compost metagenome]
MGEAGRNVRTQADTRSTEVVDRIKGSQVALDVLVAVGAEGVFGGHVVVFAVRQSQGDVVGQVVAYRAAVQVAVLEIARTVGEVTLTESFHLNCALALSQRVQRKGGNKRANGYA